MKYTKNRYLLNIIAIFLSALIYFYSSGLNDLWILAWFAPLPILLLSLYEQKTWLVFIAAILAYFLGGINSLYYLQTFMPVRVIAMILLGTLVNSIFFAVIILFARYVIKKSQSWLSIIFFPSAWVIFEFLTSRLSSAGTLDSIAYSQLKFLPIIQLASLTGIWGISFILALVPSGLATAWYLRKDRRQLSIILGLLVAVVGLSIGFGILRLSYSKPAKSINIGLLAVPATIHDLKTTRVAIVSKIIMRYIKEIPKLKQHGAKIIVMPEKLATTEISYNKAVLKLFQQAAVKNRVILVFGLNQLLKDKKLNTAFVISNTGKIIVHYHKQHLLPGPETGYSAGNKLSMFENFNGKFGVTICKDMDFINPALEYSKYGTGILLTPALDFIIDGWAHSKPAIMRGIEGGFSIVRVGQWGLLLAADKYGHILKSKPTSNQHITEFVVTVPIYSGKTFYSRYCFRQ